MKVNFESTNDIVLCSASILKGLKKLTTQEYLSAHVVTVENLFPITLVGLRDCLSRAFGYPSYECVANSVNPNYPQWENVRLEHSAQILKESSASVLEYLKSVGVKSSDTFVEMLVKSTIDMHFGKHDPKELGSEVPAVRRPMYMTVEQFSDDANVLGSSTFRFLSMKGFVNEFAQVEENDLTTKLSRSGGCGDAPLLKQYPSDNETVNAWDLVPDGAESIIGDISLWLIPEFMDKPPRKAKRGRKAQIELQDIEGKLAQVINVLNHFNKRDPETYKEVVNPDDFKLPSDVMTKLVHKLGRLTLKGGSDEALSHFIKTYPSYSAGMIIRHPHIVNDCLKSMKSILDYLSERYTREHYYWIKSEQTSRVINKQLTRVDI